MTKRDKSYFVYGALAAILLLCLFDMPYGFYTLVRFVATAAFAYLAYKEYDNKGSKNRVIVYICLAVLFQPFIKLPLGRVVWNLVDVAVAAFLVYLLVKSVSKGKNK